MKNKCDVWFLYSTYTYNKKMESGYIEKLFEKAKKYNLNIDVKDIHKFIVITGEKNEIYYDGKLVTDFPKYIIIRRFEIFLGRAFELAGVKILNSVQAMIDSKNKLKTHQMLTDAGILSPKTIYIVPRKNLSNIKYDIICEKLGSKKFILKWIYGAQGKHVHLVENEEKYNELVERYNGKVLCQEFIEASFGTDIRAYVIGGKYIGAAIRKSNGGFKSNLAQGGEALKFDYRKEVEDLAVKTAKVANLDICGVDILKGENDKLYICEVNCVPGFKSIKKTADADEKDIFLTLIYDKINNKE